MLEKKKKLSDVINSQESAKLDDKGREINDPIPAFVIPFEVKPAPSLMDIVKEILNDHQHRKNAVFTETVEESNDFEIDDSLDHLFDGFGRPGSSRLARRRALLNRKKRR